MKKIIAFCIIISLIFNCTRDENINGLKPEFSIEIKNSNSYSASFIINAESSIENIKLIWNINETTDLDNRIDEIKVGNNSSKITVNNLKQGKTYYFRMLGEFNNDIIYSETVQVTTSSILIVDDKQVGINLNTSINEIIKLDNGYIFINGGAKLEISKIDSNLNQIWSFEIRGSGEDIFYSGIHKLNDNNEFLLMYNGYSGSNEDYWGNTYGGDYINYQVKFNSEGEILNKFKVRVNVSDNIWVSYNSFSRSFSKHSKKRKLIIVSDSTYYTDNDSFQKEFIFDTNGNIISTKIINNSVNGVQLFKENDEIISYGNTYENINLGNYNRNIFIGKRDNNYNKIIPDLTFGENNTDDFLSAIINHDENIVIIGSKGFKDKDFPDSRWMFSINEQNGEIQWEIKESEDKFSYRGKDLILDNDGNYLSLFYDLYNVQSDNGYTTEHDYNIATLIKSDNEGNIIWKFVDGEENNNDDFEPVRVFQEGNEYLIFGIKQYNKIWVKRILVE